MEDIMEKGISLSDTIEAIQDELIKSQKRRIEQNKPALFETDRLVLEANCVITKNMAAEGGVEFKLIPGLSIGAKTDYASEKSMVHKITIEFKTVSSETTETTKTRRRFIDESNGIHPKAPVLKSAER